MISNAFFHALPAALAALLTAAGQLAAQAPAGGPAPAPPVLRSAESFPAIPGDGAPAGGFVVLRGDFHMHTVHSDGKLTPRDRVREAWEHGFDVIAITDHRNFAATDEAQAAGEEFGIIVLRGMETGLSQDRSADREHLVALGFSPSHQPRDSHSWADSPDLGRAYYREAWRQLADDGAFVFYAHPNVGFDAAGNSIAEQGRPLDPPLRHALREPLQWALANGCLHGIEVCNYSIIHGWGAVEDRGARWFPVALDWANEYKLTVFANSDAHQARDHYTHVTAPAATLLLARERSRAGVMEALRAGRTIAAFSGLLAGRGDMVATLVNGLARVTYQGRNGGPARLEIRNTGPLPLTANLDGADEPVTLTAWQTALVTIPQPPPALRIEWTNALVGSSAALVTSHPLQPAP
jgi:hypothetical protein